MIKLYQLLMEGRLEDFKEKYKALPSDVQDTIIQNDPSPNNKYLDWMGRAVSTDTSAKVGDVVKDVVQFDRYKDRLGDIYKFKSYGDLKHALSTMTKSNLQTKREGAEVLIDDEEFLVVAPKNQESCGYYGNNTRWCIVNQESWWNKYFYNNTIIILLDKRDNQKYAIVGNANVGDYDVYDKNDHQLSYNSFTDETSDGHWPEYVIEAIEEYMSGDDIDNRQQDFYDRSATEYLDTYGKEKVWENYLDELHSENSIAEESSVKLFYQIANKYGISSDDLETYSYRYMNERMRENGGDLDVDDLGDVTSVSNFEYTMSEIGDDISNTLKKISADYMSAVSGHDDNLEIIKNALPPDVYERISVKVSKQLQDAIPKYNVLLNDPKQSALPGIEGKKQFVQIRNIQDIIYIFKKTGYEKTAYYLESILGLKESVIRPPKVILI